MKTRLKIFLCLLMAFLPSAAFAQASVNVTVGDAVNGTVYRAIDRLVAAGVVDDAIVGQRPYSRMEVERILSEAEANFERIKDPAKKMMVWRILKRWKGLNVCHPREGGDPEHLNALDSGFRRNDRTRATGSKTPPHPDPLPPSTSSGHRKGERENTRWNVHPFERLDISYDYLGGPDRQVFDNGLGTVAGHIRPITAYRDGRQYAHGNNYSFETYHWVEGPLFAFYAHPRFQFQINEQEENVNVLVQEFYAKFGWKNFELEAGRDHIVWGQGENGGLIFSNNARGLDMVKLSNPYPVALPYLGDLKLTAVIANMGPDYNLKYSYLGGSKITLMPFRWMELGFSYDAIFRGEGAPGSTDQFFGPDLRFRVPKLMDAEFYFEYYLQERAPSGVSLADRSSYLGGLYLPRLWNANNMALRFEYQHTGRVAYRSNIWTGGLGLSGDVMGSALGPDGNGGYATFYYDLGLSSIFRFQLAYERRNGDIFAPAGVTTRPSESRYRAALSLKNQITKVVSTSWEFSYERANNFNFNRGDDRNSLLAGVNISINWDIPHHSGFPLSRE